PSGDQTADRTPQPPEILQGLVSAVQPEQQLAHRDLPPPVRFAWSGPRSKARLPIMIKESASARSVTPRSIRGQVLRRNALVEVGPVLAETTEGGRRGRPCGALSYSFSVAIRHTESLRPSIAAVGVRHGPVDEAQGFGVLRADA